VTESSIWISHFAVDSAMHPERLKVQFPKGDWT
jgi:hypothetical protein